MGVVVIAIIYIIVGIIYLILSVALVKKAVESARKRDIAGWKWGLPIALVMYFIVFWDHIPTITVHKYLCSKHAGFNVYQTLSQWENDNQNLFGEITPNKKIEPLVIGDKIRYQFNQYFVEDIIREKKILGIEKTIKHIVDLKSEKVLAKYVDYSTGILPIGLGSLSLRDYKLWMNVGSCEDDGFKKNRRKFYKFALSIKHIGDEN